MKRFMYLSIGVLCLMLSALVGFHMGSQPVQATIASEPAGNVVALAGDWAITTAGEMYFWHDGNYWVGPRQLPFPIEQLRFAAMDSGGGVTFIDASGNYWDATRGNVGPPPDGGVATSLDTWGGVKRQFDGDN